MSRSIEIKNRSGETIYTSESATTIREAVEEAVKSNVSLAWADLEGANLEEANLRNADMRGTIIAGATLAGASLAGTKF